jgi:pentatricopeptide repeat protein
LQPSGEVGDLVPEVLMSSENRLERLDLIVQPISLERSAAKLLRESREACETLANPVGHSPAGAESTDRVALDASTVANELPFEQVPNEVLAQLESAVNDVKLVDGEGLMQVMNLLARLVRARQSDFRMIERLLRFLRAILGVWDGTTIPDQKALLVVLTIVESHVDQRNFDASILDAIDADLESRGLHMVRDTRPARTALVAGDLATAHAGLLPLLAEAGFGDSDGINWLRRQILVEVASDLRKSGGPDQAENLWRIWDKFGKTAFDRHILLPALVSGLASRRRISMESIIRLTDIIVVQAGEGLPVELKILEQLLLRPPEIDYPDDHESDPLNGSEVIDRHLAEFAVRLRRSSLVALKTCGVSTERLRTALETEATNQELASIVRELRNRKESEQDVAQPPRWDPMRSDVARTIDGLLANALWSRIRDLSLLIQSGALWMNLEELRSTAAILESLRGEVSAYDTGWIITSLIRAADSDKASAAILLAEAANLVVSRLDSGLSVTTKTASILLKRWRQQLRRMARDMPAQGGSDAGLTLDASVAVYDELIESLQASGVARLRRTATAARLDPPLEPGEGVDLIALAEEIAAEHGHLRAPEVSWLIRQICGRPSDVETVLRAGRLLVETMGNNETVHGSVLMDFLNVANRSTNASELTDHLKELANIESRILELMSESDEQFSEYGDVFARVKLMGLQQQLQDALERGDLDEADRVVEELRRFGPLGPYETGWLVEGLCKFGEIDRAVAIIEEAATTPEAARGLTSYALMPVVRELVHPPFPSMNKAIELIKLAEKVTETHGKYRVIADAQMIQALVVGFAQANLPAEAEELLRVWTAERGIPIDERHYGAVVNGWSLLGDFEQCERLIEEMREGGLSPNERHLQSLASAYARAGDLGGATRVLENAWRELGQVSKHFVVITARSFARSGTPSLGVEWAERVAALPGASEHTAFEVVAANCASDDAERFVSAVEAFSRRALLNRSEIVEGLILSAAVTASLIHPNDRASLSRVVEVVEGLVTRSSRGEFDRPPLAPLAMLAKNARSASLARMVIGELEAQLKSPESTEVTAAEIGPILEVFSSFGDAEECERLWAQFVDPKRMRAQDALYLYNVLIAAHNRAPNPQQQRVEQLFTEMRSNGLSPDTFTVAHLARAQDHSGAFDDESWAIFGRDAAAALNRVVSLLDFALKELLPVFAGIDDFVGIVDYAVQQGRLDEFRSGLADVKAQMRIVSERTNDLARFAREESDAQRVIIEDIRHELNQPFMRMQLSMTEAEIAADTATAVTEIYPSWDEVKRQVAHAQDALSRYSASIARADFREDCSVKEVIDAALQSVSDKALARVDIDIELDRDRFRPNLRVIGNKFLLTRAFWALFSNAVQAMADDETQEARIRIRGAFEPPFARGATPFGRVIITVEDNGPGIPEDIRDRLMERGMTSKPGRGLGLGLAMVQSVVNAHQGSVFTAQQPGRGAYFQISLPAAAPDGRMDDDWKGERFVGKIVSILPGGIAGLVQEDDTGAGRIRPAYYCSMPGGLPPLDTRVTFRIERSKSRARGTVEFRAVDVRVEMGELP